MATKRTGKTHENLENELTPPPPVRRPAGGGEVTSPRARPPEKSRAAERSGPIGISGGDFATPSARKRTTTQPRGIPVLTPSVAKNGTPPPVAREEGALPESPFAAPPSNELGDAASRLAAEAAAVRALDSGPLTPPPTFDDPGPTPPPVAVVSAVAPPVPVASVMAPPPLPELSQPLLEARTPAPEDVAGSPAEVTPPADAEVAPAAMTFEPAGDPVPVEVPAAPIDPPHPGALPTDAMGSDDAGRDVGSVDEPPALEAHAARLDEVEPDAEPEMAAADDLEVVEGAESLDALPAEALAEAAVVTPTPAEVAPRPASAPPPIPGDSPRRKTGEMRAPEVPTAQVVASIVPASPIGATSLPEALAQRPRRPKRSKPWFEEVFDEDYLRTLPFMSADQTLREVEFIEEALAVKPGGHVLDVGCGYGRHAIELVQRGLEVTGVDLSLALLLRAADEAQKRAMSVNFVHTDMREMAFDRQFDGAYCMLTSFGYFDEETNLRVAEGIARALKPGGRLLLDLVNRDYIVSDLPSRVWWEGNGCVVLEEVDFNFHTSRILTHRSVVFEDGRQIEQEISVRAYSLHEVGRLLRQAGFRVLDVSGSLATRGHFFGATSRNLLILAEKRDQDT